MTRYFILSIFFLAAFSQGNTTTRTHAGKSVETMIADNIDRGTTAHNNPAESQKNVPALPGTQPVQPLEKAHGKAVPMDEVAHIHHFHKGRVKKIKRHHEKYWAVSKLLVILCHIVLLLMAYMHTTH